MSGDIICDEARNCRLDIKFDDMAVIPRDLIPLSGGVKSSGSSSSRTPKKQIKGGQGKRSVSVATKAKPRGRPPKTIAKTKKVGKKVQKQVKPKPRGRPPTKK